MHKAMNEIFNFKRFRTYFKYDLKQMWRNHSKAAILIGGSIAILYVVWVMCSLVFTQQWTSPSAMVRLFFLLGAFAVLEFYQTRTYGHLTEKKAGSSWLMIPASRAEKFVSMLLMTLVVIPVFFFAVYFLLDGFLSLVDPTYGQALALTFTDTYREMLDGLARIEGEMPITLSSGTLVFMIILSVFCNFLYFLLCGICFKRNKIAGAIAILFGLSLVMSIVTGLILPPAIIHLDLDEMEAARIAAGFINGSEVFACLLAVGLGWGVWRRIKTIQH